MRFLHASERSPFGILPRSLFVKREIRFDAQFLVKRSAHAAQVSRAVSIRTLVNIANSLPMKTASGDSVTSMLNGRTCTYGRPRLRPMCVEEGRMTGRHLHSVDERSGGAALAFEVRAAANGDKWKRARKKALPGLRRS